MVSCDRRRRKRRKEEHFTHSIERNTAAVFFSFFAFSFLPLPIPTHPPTHGFSTQEKRSLQRRR